MSEASDEVVASKTLADLLDEEPVGPDEEEPAAEGAETINQQLASTSSNEDSNSSSSDNVDVDRSCKESVDDESDKSKKSEPTVDVGVTKVSSKNNHFALIKINRAIFFSPTVSR